jgi:hypothetical protein
MEKGSNLVVVVAAAVVVGVHMVEDSASLEKEQRLQPQEHMKEDHGVVVVVV